MAKARRSRSTDRNRLTSAMHRPMSVPPFGASRATSTSVLVTKIASDCDGAAAKLALFSRLPLSLLFSSGTPQLRELLWMLLPGAAAHRTDAPHQARDIVAFQRSRLEVGQLCWISEQADTRGRPRLSMPLLTR